MPTVLAGHILKIIHITGVNEQVYKDTLRKQSNDFEIVDTEQEKTRQANQMNIVLLSLPQDNPLRHSYENKINGEYLDEELRQSWSHSSKTS